MKSKNKTEKQSYKGIISISSRGRGYVRLAEFEEDIEIDPPALGTALNGDLVEIYIFKRKIGKHKGEVIQVLRRANLGFAGVLKIEDGVYYLSPDDYKVYTEILIQPKNLARAKPGDKVYVEIIHWKNARTLPEGKITKILGKPGENNTEMQAIAMEKGFDSDFPKRVIKEANLLLERGISNQESRGRRDFRDTLTFTIDPADAKDFDDAISFKKIGKDEYEIGVHIADVTYFVKEGSLIDKEAQKRGTSVYLVDRTVHMLPEALSANLCSLLPNTDRLTMSCVFTLNKKGVIKDEWYGRSIINSKKRFAYEEAEETLKNKELPYNAELTILNDIAKNLKKTKMENGAISLDQEEIRFVLDDKGKPIEILKKERGDSNHLIEEFMLLANKQVAQKLAKFTHKDGIFLYRIHASPNREKMQDLIWLLQGLGFKPKLEKGIISSNEINKILLELEGKPEKDTVHRAVIRSMEKAIYSTKNIGHYGLAFTHYTHFTSPIRRYPDMLVHRFLSMCLENKKINASRLLEFEKLSQESSTREKYAVEAERNSIKYKQVEYMSTRVGQKFEGIITGLNERSIFVEETTTKCEGMVSVRDLDDFFVYDPQQLELKGEKTGKRYKFGDRVKIQIKEVNLEKKMIDYLLI